MAGLNGLFQSADWKTEKHVPVIEMSDAVKKGELASITVTVGKEIPHPNKAEHHISWIAVFFQPDGDKYPYQIGKTEFSAHGESAKGADTSTVYAHPKVTINFKAEVPGTIYAASYCNIHGLWESSKKVSIA
ncbi:MAG: class II SORL domain-containing protein [Candidatus Omnitrophota bacterium]|jgi:superoxide reductase